MEIETKDKCPQKGDVRPDNVCSSRGKKIEKQQAKRIQKLEERIVELESQLHAVEASISYRLTKPLRVFKGWIKSNLCISWLRDQMKNLLKYHKVPINPPNGPKNTSGSETVTSPMHKVNHDRLDVTSFVRNLLPYDVISFDVFDTLILRTFEEPTDVFRLLGHRIGEESFASLRKQAEHVARDYADDKENEVTIFEIYEELSQYLQIDSKAVIDAEFQAEKDCCFPNPFMKAVFDQLILAGKEVIILSDMYWPAGFLQDLLRSCGYEGYSKLYVSCDCQKGKHSGNLFAMVQSEFESGKTFVHIGDNMISDVQRAREAGWESVYYQACREVNEKFAAKNMNRLSVSAYNGVVNSYFCAGQLSFHPAYEYGFRYAGFLVSGFCEWLNTFAENNHIDKILFLARDTDIFYKVYNQYYRKFENSYVVVSRLASWIMAFASDTEEFIRYFFLNRAHMGTQTLAEVLEETDMDILIPLLQEHGLKEHSLLTSENYAAFRNFLYDNKELVVAHFALSANAGEEYLKSAIGDAKNVCAVDIGWNGQILITMRKIVQRICEGSVNLRGAYMALNANETSTGYVESGIITPWLYHECMNRDIAIDYATVHGDMEVKLIEATFTSCSPTLLKYIRNEDGSVGFMYGIQSADTELVEQLQKGILDFVEMWKTRTDKLYPVIQIMPRDAKEIFDIAVSDKQYMNSILGSVREWEFALPNFKGLGRITTLSEMMKNSGIIQNN